MGIRRQDLQAIVRAERGIQLSGKNLRNLRLNLAPDPRRLPSAITKISRGFSFVVELTGFDTTTGKDLTQDISVALDEVKTRSEIEALAVDFIDRDFERYGLEIQDVLLIRGLKAGEAGTVLGRPFLT